MDFWYNVLFCIWIIVVFALLFCSEHKNHFSSCSPMCFIDLIILSLIALSLIYQTKYWTVFKYWFCFTVTNGIYLDAKKSGTDYYWSTGGKAYFTTADVTDSGVGECVYISKSTNSLQGTDCSNTYNVLCQSSKFFSFNLQCFPSYELSICNILIMTKNKILFLLLNSRAQTLSFWGFPVQWKWPLLHDLEQHPGLASCWYGL